MPTCALIVALLLVNPLDFFGGGAKVAPLLLANQNSTPRRQDDGEVTLDRLFGGEFSESGFEPAGDWLPDGKSLVSVEGESDIVKVNSITGKQKIIVRGTKLIPPGASRPISIERFSLSDDGKQVLIFTNSVKVWRQNTKGDYWVYDIEEDKLRQLGDRTKPSSLMFAKLSPDGTKAGYVYENNLYVQDLDSNKPEQLTKDGSKTLINGTFDWVYEEELDLRDGWRWSPDSEKIAYWQLDSSMEPIYTLIDDTDSTYPSVKRFPYPKTGEANPTVRIGIVSTDGGKTQWINDKADSKSGYIARMDWADSSDEIIYQKLNRKQNKDEYRIANSETGESRLVYADADDAWVDILDTAPDGVKWIDGGKRFVIFSEHEGWRHMYSISRDGTEVRDLTPGNFDVKDLSGIDTEHGLIYFSASPGDSTQAYLFSTDIDKPKVKRLTPPSAVGTNEYRLSPNGTVAVHTHSSFSVPSERELVSLPDHHVLRIFGDNALLKSKLKKLKLGVAKLIKLQAADGESMDASIIFPPDFDAKKRYPLFFEVYGEPAGTTVHDQWEGFGYLFHQMLAEMGYIVASVDNRGTPTLKGRKWRKSVYKKIGIIASQDQAAAAKQLSDLPFVDSTRIGIWGWSGGGSMTLNMLFRYPDIYSLGMSVAPVPDARLYDTIYQERYMGTPQEDPVAYRECSPITFAKQLKGNLLIVHGSGDDNVHYQGTERLINELVADEKPFQLMVYPNRTHSISEGPGTTRHLYDLLVRFLTTNMPPGGR